MIIIIPSVVLFLALWSTDALKMVMLDVPSLTNQGESVELNCIYDLDSDRLYSIKWYKNDVEFYRYVPNDWPPGQFLPLPGIKVDLSKSGRKSVYLRHVDVNSTGTYRCEVSAEAPSFQTVEAEKEMHVLVLPTDGPRITGGQPKYNIGDPVVINCTSAKSKPAATLRWFINDQVVGPEYATEYSTTLHADGLETSSLSLKFIASEKHFHDQNMRLRCTATISKMYTMSNEELFLGGRQQTSTLHITEKLGREKPIKNRSSTSAKPAKTENPIKTWSSTSAKPDLTVKSTDASSNIFPTHHWFLLLLHLIFTIVCANWNA